MERAAASVSVGSENKFALWLFAATGAPLLALIVGEPDLGVLLDLLWLVAANVGEKPNATVNTIDSAVAAVKTSVKCFFKVISSSLIETVLERNRTSQLERETCRASPLPEP